MPSRVYNSKTKEGSRDRVCAITKYTCQARLVIQPPTQHLITYVTVVTNTIARLMTARHIMPLVSLIQYSSGNGSKSAGEITELKKFGWKAVQRRTKLESKALCESFGRRSTRENIAQIRRRRLTQIKIHAQKKILHSPKTRKIGSAASTGISNFVLSLVEHHPLIITEPSYL